MADNFLEKRMYDHIHGKPSRPAARRAPRGFVFPPLTVLAVNNAGEAGHEVISTLAAAGHRVMFTTDAPAGGTALAQACGARYYPLPCEAAASDMLARGERVDVAVIIGGDALAAADALKKAGQMPGLRIFIDAYVSDSCQDVDGPFAVLDMKPSRAAAIMALALMHPEVSSTSPRFRVRSGD